MPTSRPSAPLVALLSTAAAMTLAAAACSREASGVRMVEAKIDGITCDKCVPPLTRSLQKHFTSAAVVVDDASDTATLRLPRGQAFSAAEFGRAVSDVKMRVVTVRLEACGRAETQGTQRILDAGGSRFLLRGDQTVPMNQPVCVDGRLDDTQTPAVLDISAVSVTGS
jgi:hypothetical protein